MEPQDDEREESDFQLIITANISGTDFSYRKLIELTNLPLDLKCCHEKGDEWVRKTTRRTYGNGQASIKARVEWLHERNVVFDKLLDSLIANQEAIRACGATQINFGVAVFKSIQGNWEATASQIQKLAKLNSPLAVTYYPPVEPGEEPWFPRA